MKKFATMAICFVLIACMVAGGSLAYLTDRDSEANVFTVGDVRIDLTEDFAQGTRLTPGEKIEKEAVIKNTGVNDAYVWMTVALPSALDVVNAAGTGAADGSSENIIHWNVPGAFWDTYHNKAQFINSAIANGYLPKDSTGVEEAKTWNLDTPVFNAELEGVKYNVYTLLYNSAIKPGEVTNIGLSEVYMDTAVDIDTNGDWYHVEKGVATKLEWNTNTNGAPIIYVSAYGIQADGFEDVVDNGTVTKKAVEVAYEAYNGQWDNPNTTDVNEGSEWADVTVVNASTKDEMKTAVAAALTAGATEVVVDAKGANIGDLNSGLTKAMVPEGTTVTIANAVVEGRSYGNAVDGTVVFTNCVFENPNGAYSIHFDAGKGNVVFNNCTLSGWCSYGSAITGVEMNNCTIKGNGIYAMQRFYQDTTLNNCIIDCGNSNTTDVYVDGISAVNGATVTLNNCTITNVDYEVDGEGAKIIVDGTAVAEV